MSKIVKLFKKSKNQTAHYNSIEKINMSGMSLTFSQKIKVKMLEITLTFSENVSRETIF